MADINESVSRTTAETSDVQITTWADGDCVKAVVYSIEYDEKDGWTMSVSLGNDNGDDFLSPLAKFDSAEAAKGRVPDFVFAIYKAMCEA